MNRLGGVGLVNMVVIALFTVFFIVAMKSLLTIYHVDGLSELMLAA